jgi:single-stranded-DNA-specific exonuclease
VHDVSYRIAPRINASGRVQNGAETVELLIEKDIEKARIKAKQIDTYNDTRRDLDKNTTEEAGQLVKSLDDLSDRNSIVLYKEEWHTGVIGIVTSRLTDLYYRPTIVLTRNGEQATGSARSVGGFDIYKALEHCQDLLTNFGGHAYASGLSLPPELVPEFSRRFEEYVTAQIRPEQQVPTLRIDAYLDFRDLTMKLLHDIEKLEPHGPGNESPLFCTRRVYDYGTSKIIGRFQEHLKVELVDSKSNKVMNGIAFGLGECWTKIRTKRAFDVCYHIKENAHRKGEIQLQIEAIRPNEDN